MRKIRKCITGIVSWAACGILFFSVGACSRQADAEKVFKLPHFDASDESESYDTDLLYKNNSKFYGGDSGVIWVSEEQDAEYGGYFYQYMSDCGGVANPGSSAIDENGNRYWGHFVLTRSKDLNDWEICGAVGNGWCLKITDPNAWCNVIGNDTSMFFAPEVIYKPCDCTGDTCTVHGHDKYYMYYSAKAKRNDGSIEGALYSSATSWVSRQYIGVAVSDTPVGPFEMVTSENYYGDAEALDLNGYSVDTVNPQIMFERLGFGSEKGDTGFANYDAHPWFDEDGTLYLYFVKANNYSAIWGMKMKDMVTPDFSTVSNLVENFDAVRVLYKGSSYNDPEYPRHYDSSWDILDTWEDGTKNVSSNSEAYFKGGKVHEAPQMLTSRDSQGRKVYLLTFCPTGVQAPDYDVCWAYSYDPLGPYTKPKNREFSTVIGLDVNNDFMTNLGHVQFLHVDGEDWILHWEWTAPFGSVDIGRLCAVTPMTWIQDSRADFPVPVANGPTTVLQRLPSVASGYTNVAPRASVSATNAEQSTVKYLNDGLFVTRIGHSDRQFIAEKQTKITLTFNEAVYVRGLLVHNSYEYANAFRNISYVAFTLAEKPVWREGAQTECVITNLGFTKSAYNGDAQSIQAGAAAVATFNEIKVTKIEIFIAETDMMEEGKKLHIGEIEVLGR
ncbi:MAG: hypothetical protein SPH68_01175 [Candidatus Borkfalkiaceae bacterium]|nr:hypothetical protein [Clostridia bacterium]MDY6222756.1 hypothetical protein [Christensenellaceae bacterium]